MEQNIDSKYIIGAVVLLAVGMFVWNHLQEDNKNLEKLLISEKNMTELQNIAYNKLAACEANSKNVDVSPIIEKAMQCKSYPMTVSGQKFDNIIDIITSLRAICYKCSDQVIWTQEGPKCMSDVQ